jgi:cardiolipin synthase A/B
VTNGFPLLLELQHALVRAVQRGVRVRVLTGHIAPMYGTRVFSGPWSLPRTVATDFLHSRLDPIVDAGGEVYLFVRRDVSGWDPALGAVCPYVHAKLMSADGAVCAVGSANLDATSSYWETELLLVIEDAEVTGRLEARLDDLVATATRVDRSDPAWRERARRRSWMRRWPGVLEV